MIQKSELLDICIAPQGFKLIVLASLRQENVYQDIEIVQQYPLLVLKTLHMDGRDVGHSFGLLLHKIAQSIHMRLGCAGADYKIVKINMIDFLKVEAVNINTLFLKQRLNYQLFKVSLKRDTLIFHFSFCYHTVI